MWVFVSFLFTFKMTGSTTVAMPKLPHQIGSPLFEFLRKQQALRRCSGTKVHHNKTIFLETYFHLYYFNTIIGCPGCPGCPHVQILSSKPTFAPGTTEPGHLNVAISKRGDFCHRKFKRVIPALEDQGSTNIQTSNKHPTSQPVSPLTI